VNLAAVDIYYPGLRSDLLAVTGTDVYFDAIYTEMIAPNGLRERKSHPPQKCVSVPCFLPAGE
jgi:hypothetical protein